MLFIFILIVIACILLALIVLIQNPKGGGLSGTLAGFNNQFMGVKQTTDVLEKGTWIFASVLMVLCIVSSLFISGGTTRTDTGILKDIPTSTVPTTTNPGSNNATQQQQPNPVQTDSGKR